MWYYAYPYPPWRPVLSWFIVGRGSQQFHPPTCKTARDRERRASRAHAQSSTPPAAGSHARCRSDFFLQRQ
eukprot:7383558-Prymnesium_polylepis.2